MPYGRGFRGPERPSPPRTIIFYGFSILGEVMNQAVYPAFQRQWEAKTGEQVEFISSFAGSGTVTNQLIMGVPAHLALLSLELDAHRLGAAGVTPPASWERLPHRGSSTGRRLLFWCDPAIRKRSATSMIWRGRASRLYIRIR